MQINLLSCAAQRPDKRAIAQCIAEISPDVDESLARELTDIFLEGEQVTIAIADKTTSSALRALRKLEIDYEIVE